MYEHFRGIRWRMTTPNFTNACRTTNPWTELSIRKSAWFEIQKLPVNLQMIGLSIVKSVLSHFSWRVGQPSLGFRRMFLRRRGARWDKVLQQDSIVCELCSSAKFWGLPPATPARLRPVTPPSQHKTPKMYQVELFLSQKGMRVEDSIDKASKMREDGAIDVRFIVQI